MAGVGSLEIVCPSCSAPLPANARFCLDCGAPVEERPDREVRKTVTLLFTDVMGSTAMGEGLDPEAYRWVLGRYFDVARAAVERHGGTVEKFVGDAVLAVFGVPEVREDDALRALRTAHELNYEVARLSEELSQSHGITLGIRTGVNTGSVVVGSARAGGSFATGDAVNTAARLEQAAGPGEILLGAATWELVRDAVLAEPVEPVAAKGKTERVPAYRLLTVREDEDGRARRWGDPLVGRAREIRALDDALERTVESGRSHLVTVIGAPGIGKTRLIREFVERVGDRAHVVSGRCVSYGQGITFFPIVNVIRSAIRLSGEESDELVRHALLEAMGGATDASEVVDLLLPLLGAGGARGNHDQTFWAVRRLLEQRAQERPLVVTLDDLHWAEPTLLDLLELVRDEVADLPLLLVCGARPEFLEKHPTWGSGSLNTVTFGLEPFDGDQVSARVAAILGGPGAKPVTDVVSEWSGGNPLFVEELALHLVDAGQVRRVGDRWELADDLREIRMPPTVAALLAARLDRLPPEERDVLERLAVIGLEFTTADALALAAEDARDRLTATLPALVRRDLLRRVRGTHGDSWAFRHATIRDAAYDALSKALRADLHERFAGALSGADAGADAGAERLAFVGHHLEQSVLLRRELAPHDPDLTPLVLRTADTFYAASVGAVERDDLPAAVALARSALRLDLPSSRRRDLLVWLLKVLHDQYRIAEAAIVTEELAAATDDSMGPLDELTLAFERTVISTYAAESPDPAGLIDLGERLSAMARTRGDALRLGRSLYGRLPAYAMTMQWRSIQNVLEETEALELPGSGFRSRTLRGGVATYGELPLSEASAYVRAGVRGPVVTDTERLALDLFDALSLTVTDVSAARRLALHVAERARGAGEDAMIVITGLGGLFYLVGDLDRSIAWFARSVELMTTQGDEAHGSTYLALQALEMLERADATEDVAPLVEQVRGWSSPYDLHSVALLEVADCLLALRTGDRSAARAHAERAVADIDRGEQTWDRADVRRRVSAWARASGEADTERRLLTEALELYRRKQIPLWAAVCENRLTELG